MGYLTPPPSPQPVVVYKDVGGLVSEYEAQTELYRRENREVRLHECRSACTLALSLPNVCVYPDAQVKFHQAYNAITREVDLGVSDRLFESYPSAVRGRLGYLTRQYKVLRGTELIALGMRNCLHDDSGVMIASRKTNRPPPPAAADPLHDIAENVRVAVASALNRPEDAPPGPTRIVAPDRAPVPPALARLAGDAEARRAVAARPEADGLRVAYLGQARGGLAPESRDRETEVPLPPRRPDLAEIAAEAAPAAARDPEDSTSPQLIRGAQPILDSTRFAPRVFSLRAEAARRNLDSDGG
ncbi:hypothetical protein [Methylocystis heyeri]|uniref:hypothetical protein n=1 Tax=Methylocystis heyeri TaxID=391905 RepID=UPI00113461A4|nr:hypothetical protein [Methylocystis heyeri]